MNTGTTRLALVMIARNEAACIARCLQSARSFVDDIIVLDTGSTDDTAAIAADNGARVHRFTWLDDFAAARNAALELSDAAWNLVLDADEWLEDGAEQLGPDQLGTEPFIGLVPVTSSFDLHGQVETATSWLPRILPAGVRYRGRIHEQPESGLPRRRVPVGVAHDGYRQTQLRHKQGRNRALLLQVVEDSPTDAYLRYQLGKDYEIYEDYASAIREFREALQYAELTEPFRHDLVLRTIFSLKQAGEHEAAIHFAQAELPNWEHSPDFFFSLGDLLLDWATLNPDKAVQELLPMIASSWSRCLEIGDQPGLEGSVRGRGSHLAAHNLAVLYDGLGDKDQAAHYHSMAASMRNNTDV
jgi:tetratricopeptide (TPR) repeat protein